jgi:large subunit ribosomal protein L19
MAEQKTYPALDPKDLTSGQVVRVHEKIQEVSAKGAVRERVQIFEGIVTAVRGAGNSRSFMVRKESDGYGVEKIFPVNSPSIAKLELVKTFKTRRAVLTPFIKGFERKLKEVKVKKTVVA